jgi:hypothetical protein
LVKIFFQNFPKRGIEKSFISIKFIHP